MLGYFVIWLVFVPAVEGQFLYPFGSTAGDVAVAKADDACNYVYNHQIYMFGVPFNKIYVCTNGVISLNRAYTSFTPEAFPLQSIYRAPLICPFWADVDIRKGGNVWSRESTDPALLERASLEVRDAFTTESAYNATWLLIVTWDAVRVYGSFSTTMGVNTFQAVLISDGDATFAIFKYKDINWTHGSPTQTPAQVGFDSGDGTHYYATPDSQKPAIANIEAKSNVGIPGKMMFKLGSANATASQVIQIPDKPSPSPNFSSTQLYHSTSTNPMHVSAPITASLTTEVLMHTYATTQVTTTTTPLSQTTTEITTTTTSLSQTTTAPKVHIAAIVVPCVLAAALFLAIVISAALLVKRWQRRKGKVTHNDNIQRRLSPQ